MLGGNPRFDIHGIGDWVLCIKIVVHTLESTNLWVGCR